MHRIHKSENRSIFHPVFSLNAASVFCQNLSLWAFFVMNQGTEPAVHRVCQHKNRALNVSWKGEFMLYI